MTWLISQYFKLAVGTCYRCQVARLGQLRLSTNVPGRVSNEVCFPPQELWNSPAPQELRLRLPPAPRPDNGARQQGRLDSQEQNYKALF
jgi:hypothetical protein